MDLARSSGMGYGPEPYDKPAYDWSGRPIPGSQTKPPGYDVPLPGAPPPELIRPKSSLVALILGIVGLFIPFVCVVAIIFGIIALVQIGRGKYEKGLGLAIAGIVLGAIGIVTTYIILLSVLLVWTLGLSTGGGGVLPPTMSGHFIAGPGPDSDRNWSLEVDTTEGSAISISYVNFELENEMGATRYEASEYTWTRMGDAYLWEPSYEIYGGGTIMIFDNDMNEALSPGDRIVIDAAPGDAGGESQWHGGWEVKLSYSGAIIYTCELPL